MNISLSSLGYKFRPTPTVQLVTRHLSEVLLNRRHGGPRLVECDLVLRRLTGSRPQFLLSASINIRLTCFPCGTTFYPVALVRNPDMSSSPNLPSLWWR